MKDFAAEATQYCVDVVSGHIWVSELTRMACQRHLDDLARQNTPGFPYYFSPEALNKFGRFCEMFHIFEGPKAGQNICLAPWQSFFYSFMGWLVVDGPRKDKRKYRRAIMEVPRGNSKSTMASLVALWFLAVDGEGGAQCVSAGTSRDVARISWNAAAEMARREPEFMKALGVEILAHSIIHRRSASRFHAISADAKTSDGKNLHICVFDEAWSFKTRTLYDSLETGTAKRDNSLMLVVGTAGFNQAGIAYELRSYLIKVLNKTVTDESTFGLIYTAPFGYEDQWYDEEVLEAANPAWNDLIDRETVMQLVAKAQVAPSAINSLKVKHLCIWCSAASPWLDMARFKTLEDPSLNIEDFYGQPCFIGLDLSTKTDLTAKVMVFPREEISPDGSSKTNYYIFPKQYLPDLAVKKSKNSSYSGWARQGFLTVTDGDVTDFSTIESDLLDDMRDFDVQAVAFDPWSATQLAQRLMAEGLNMVEVRMTTGNLSEPMKTCESLVLQNRLHYKPDEVFYWCVGNVCVQEDRNRNVFPRREADLKDNKIDSAVALILGMAVALSVEGTVNDSLVCVG